MSKRGRLEFEEPTPFPPEQLAALRRNHQPDGDYENPGCAECYRLWPCYTSRLLVMIPDPSDVPWDHSDEDSVNGTLEDGPPVPGGVTAVRNGQYVTERPD